jgi:hypothetical protein
MTLKMLMDSMSTSLFRLISPCLTLRSREREQVLRKIATGQPVAFFIGTLGLN